MNRVQEVFKGGHRHVPGVDHAGGRPDCSQCVPDLVDAFKVPLARIRVPVIRSTRRFECIRGQSSDGNVFVARIMQNSPEMAVDVTAKASAVGIIARNRVEAGDANRFTSLQPDIGILADVTANKPRAVQLV